jgi:hypothetical protein
MLKEAVMFIKDHRQHGDCGAAELTQTVSGREVVGEFVASTQWRAL